MNIVLDEVEFIIIRQSEFNSESVYSQSQFLGFLVIAADDQSNDKIGAGTLSKLEAYVS